MKLQGASVSQLVNGMRRAVYEVGKVSRQTVAEVSREIYDDAQERVPKATGALWASARLTDTSEGTKAEAVISYGDYTVNPNTGKPTADYAEDRHENPLRTGDKGYKWLENASLDHASAFHERAQANFKQLFN